MRSDPAAIVQTLGDVEEDRLSIDETDIDRALSAAFDQHALSVASATFDAGLAAGVLRLTGKGTTPATGHSGVTQQTQASLDLRTFALDQSSVLTLTKLPRNWNDVSPQVALEWTGPFESPVRNIDATSFVNALAARAIARETARIEAQEFDVHEHAVALARLESARRQEADRLQAIEDVKHAVLRARARDATLERLKLLLATEKQKAAEKAARTQPLAIMPAPQATPSAPRRPRPARRSPCRPIRAPPGVINAVAPSSIFALRDGLLSTRAFIGKLSRSREFVSLTRALARSYRMEQVGRRQILAGMSAVLSASALGGCGASKPQTNRGPHAAIGAHPCES